MERKVKMVYLHNATAFHFPGIGQLEYTLIGAGMDPNAQYQQTKSYGFEITFNEQGGFLRLKRQGIEAILPCSNVKFIVYAPEDTAAPKATKVTGGK